MNKTKIVTIASHKGGVGKTTSAVTLGSLLSSKGKRTLLVDLDAQRNLTRTFMDHRISLGTSFIRHSVDNVLSLSSMYVLILISFPRRLIWEHWTPS